MSLTILIVSTSGDVVTNKVIACLKSKHCNVLRLNQRTFTKFSKLKDLVSGSDFIWMRRGNFCVAQDTPQFVKNEYIKLTRYLHFLVSSRNKENVLGSLEKGYDHNKLIDLDVACSCGLMIPVSAIINDRSDFVNLKLKYPALDWITKPCSEVVNFTSGEFTYSGGYTTEIDEVGESFFPSIIQQKINKQLDIRSFYIKGSFYSMAIFSQNNSISVIDNRKLKGTKTRKIPFQLPRNVERKLEKFLKIRSLNTASIDIALSVDNQFYFLEANPNGQLDYLSVNCNYYLEKVIAELLTHDSE